ncbi:hypothetical protein [Streptomyces sp. NPDC060194]|uniref:hypothetical protein n=1 Tax=Streptomyces sp. NPDC060194 TaxID=3347069 RepID=UPI003646C23B
MDAAAQYESGDTRSQKVSVSMPADRIAAVKARVGARGFSAYISAAVERQIQRDLIDELLARNEAEAAPITQEMHDQAAASIRAAMARAAGDDRPEPVSREDLTIDEPDEDAGVAHDQGGNRKRGTSAKQAEQRDPPPRQ